MNEHLSIQSTIQETVNDSVSSFHLRAFGENGDLVSIPCSYQIAEPGFNPFRGGKVSGEELQAKLDATIDEANSRGIDIGIEGYESLQKLAIQLGLGIDCSNFVFRSLELVHQRLELPDYASTVSRNSSEILELNRTNPRWKAKDEDGQPRELNEAELETLHNDGLVPIDWIAKTFGKDHGAFIAAAKHIASADATTAVSPDELQPGDIISFRSSGTNTISHVAIIDYVNSVASGVKAEFWHSWHTRDFDSGLRPDTATFADSNDIQWSHNGLADPTRYSGYSLHRPNAVAHAIEQAQ